jgi:primosomal protein N'
LPATHTCTYCGSWNITPVSIGTESIRDAIAALVGPEVITTIDDDLTPDTVAIQNMLAATEKQKFAIIIGTIKVLPFLKNINYSLFPFFDRLLSTPSLYTTENVLRLIMETSEKSADGVLVFTRQPEFPLIKQLETHKINAIIHDELTLRKELGYPPFGSIVKISLTVPEGYRLSVIERMQTYLLDAEATMMPARRISMGSMKMLLTWIIKVPTTYIEEEGPTLAGFLTSLHFPYLIEENPERL